MLSKYQKQKLFYFLIQKSNSFLNFKKTCKEISRMTYELNICSMTEEEKDFLKNNQSSVNALNVLDIYEIINNDSYKEFETKSYLYYRSFIINSDYTDLDKSLEKDDEIDDIKTTCNFWNISIHKSLELDENIIIPNLTDSMKDANYLLECDKSGIFNFSKWINLLKDYRDIREKLKDKVFHLGQFLSLEFLNITELKSISPELYQILKNNKL